MADTPAREPIGQAETIDQKGGNSSDNSTTKLAGPSKMSEPPVSVLVLPGGWTLYSLQIINQEGSVYASAQPKKSCKSMEQKGGKRSDDSTTKLTGPSKMLVLELSDDATEKLKRTRKLEEKKMRKRSDDSTTKPAGPSKSLEQKGGKRSDDSTTKLASLLKSLFQVLEKMFHDLQIDGMRSGDTTALEKILHDLQKEGMWSGGTTIRMACPSKLKGGKGSDDSFAEYKMIKPAVSELSPYTPIENRKLEEVQLQTQRLIVHDRLKREDEVNVKPIHGKMMCCRPFKEKNLAQQKKPVILRAHLYEDLIKNSDLVKRQEEEQEFVPAHPEQQIFITVAEGDLKMTCFVKETVIGEPAVVPIDKLMSGARICKPFELDFTNQPDIVAMSLIIGQTERLEDKLLFPLDFSTPHRRERASPQVQEQLQGASSSQTTQTSHHTTDETLENISGRQEDFEEKLNTVARKVAGRIEIDNLGKALGFAPEDIKHYVDENTNTRYMGTLSMLRDWRKKQTKATERKVLKGALEKAGQNHLADELFGTA